MRTARLFILLIICAVWISCKNTPTAKCGPCPEIMEVAPFINVRIVDKTSGADLFLSPASPYKLSDLSVISSIDGSAVNVFVDSLQKDNRFIRFISTTSQTFKLKLSTLPEDDIIVTTKNDSPKCCSILTIKKIVLNTTTVCSPCNFNQLITIKK
ncbi:MAG: hypothetical protein ACXVA2_09095 [Mucilaginibacter sp.]